MKDIILLGSTGSVGRNVLDVVRHYPERFRLKAISSNANLERLIKQAGEFSPEIVAIGDETLYPDLKAKVKAPTRVVSGKEALMEIAGEVEADIVFMAIAGTAALKPLVAALENGRTVALASKEPVVSAGMIIRKLMEEKSSSILPVDSEHSAIMQCLGTKTSEEVRALYITGSGGSLKDIEEKDFAFLSKGEVLNHPKWSMGEKITVDSATLMNKGLEVIEAKWLFNMPQEKIKVVIHPEAIIHSMVEFVDGTINASLFYPDMRFPILKALTYPEVVKSDFPRVDFSAVKNFSFLEPDRDKFPALELAYEALREGGTVPAVLNSANERAVGLFLEEKIKFTDIVRVVEETIKKHVKKDDPSLEDIIDAEKWASEEVKRFC